MIGIEQDNHFVDVRRVGWRLSGGALDHDDVGPRLGCDAEFRRHGPAAGVLRNERVDPVRREDSSLVVNGKWRTLQPQRQMRRHGGFGRFDHARCDMHVGAPEERANLLAPDGNQRARSSPQLPRRHLNARRAVPGIILGGLPWWPFEPKIADTDQAGGITRLEGHPRRKRMRAIHEHCDRRIAHEPRQTFGTAETAQTYVTRDHRRLPRTTREGRDD